MTIHIHLGIPAELQDYYTFSAIAQARLQAEGLKQYVPSAHAEYHSAFAEKLKHEEFFVVTIGDQAVAGFCLSETPASWWVDASQNALYFSNLVVRVEHQRQGIGRQILAFSEKIGHNRGKSSLRLDCFAENTWLCQYYEAYGFVWQARVKQHIDYWGNLYEYRFDHAG